jgi:hypothetical protein
MKKTKPTALQSLKLALHKADKTLRVTGAAIADLVQTQGTAATETSPTEAAVTPQITRVDALPPTPEGQRVDNSPYSRESRP